MRVMVLMPADKNSEAGILDEKLMAGMAKYYEDVVKAGVMLTGEGLHPSSGGARVRVSPTGKPTVIDGPFTEAKELIAGYCLWQVKSLDEAIEWVKRLPVYLEREGWTPTQDYEIEIRPVFEATFKTEHSPELNEQVTEQETRIRAQATAKVR